MVWKHLKPLHPWGCHQVLSGIAFCHTHGVVHRDLRLGEQQRTVGKTVLLWRRLVFATVEGSDMRKKKHLGCIKLKNNGLNYQPQLVQDFSVNSIGSSCSLCNGGDDTCLSVKKASYFWRNE